MSTGEPTHFIEYDENGDLVIDYENLEQRLEEEDLEEALERDDVTIPINVGDTEVREVSNE